MKFRFLLILNLLLFFCACGNKDSIRPDGFEECFALSDVKILTEVERQNTCIYSDVFRYQGAIYTVCECCLCDKVYMAYDCEGNQLCDHLGNCMIDFNKNATYLLSVGEF